MARTATEKLNTLQLSIIRQALKEETRYKGRLKNHEVPLRGASHDVFSQIEDQGFAYFDEETLSFYLTDEGRDRALRPADRETRGMNSGSALFDHWNPEDES